MSDKRAKRLELRRKIAAQRAAADGAEYVDEFGVEFRFGLPVQTLRTQRSRGGGPPFRKLGTRVLYSVAAVREYIETLGEERGGGAL